MIRTWGSVIDALGGTGPLAETLAQSDSTVSGWRKRGIPAKHWAAIIALAANKGLTEITLDVLATADISTLEEARP